MRGKILIVEDDPLIADMVRRYLEREGFKVLWDKRGEEAVRTFRAFNPDLVILDLMLPDADGFDLCRTFSQTGSMILILTAKDEQEDRVAGLEVGADDYMTKPFHMRELIARVKALLRRKYKIDSGGPTLRVGEFEIRDDKRKIYLGGKPLDLTPKEFLILRKLLAKRGKVVSRQELASEIYEDEPPDYERIIDTYIYRIRTRLLERGREYASRIKTVRGFGYSFE
jgi:DNA-binding response OmpR family regulator